MESAKKKNLRQQIIVNGALVLLVVLWMIPTIGLLVSSFRTRFDIQTSGWWSIFPHKEWVVSEEIDPREEGLDATGPMEIYGITATFEELREGIQTPDGKQVKWIGNRRIGWIEVQEKKWNVRWDFTLENYRQVLQGKDFEYLHQDGTVEIIPGDDFWGALFNSIAVSVPATVIPILIAAFAAYGFAWIKFPGRKRKDINFRRKPAQKETWSGSSVPSAYTREGFVRTKGSS